MCRFVDFSFSFLLNFERDESNFLLFFYFHFEWFIDLKMLNNIFFLSILLKIFTFLYFIKLIILYFI